MAEETTGTEGTRVAGTGEVVTFSPKPYTVPVKDEQGNTTEQDRQISSLTFEVGTTDKSVDIGSGDWPYTTAEPDEIEFLRNHPYVQEDKVEEQGPSATDAAKSLAQQEGVDLASVEGTGKDGNITKEDVERHLSENDPGEDN